jgi:hypothetical protein
VKVGEEAYRLLVEQLALDGWGEGDVDDVLEQTWGLYHRAILWPGIDDDPEGRKVLGKLGRAVADARAHKPTGQWGRAMAQVLERINRGALDMLEEWGEELRGRDPEVRTRIARHWRARGGLKTRDGEKCAEASRRALALVILVMERGGDSEDVDADMFTIELERVTASVKEA